MEVGAGDAVVELMQRREIVDDPEAAALRRDDEIAVAHLQIGDRHLRQVQLERLPALSPSSKDTYMPYSVPA